MPEPQLFPPGFLEDQGFPPQEEGPASIQASMGSGQIDKIVESIQGGLLRPTKYTCKLTMPNLMGGKDVTYELAESTALPGRSLATIQRRIWGPIYDIPYERLYSGDLELVFILSVNTIEKHRTAFSKWMDIIISDNALMITGRDQYTGTMVITLENDKGESVMGVELEEVYPKSIQPISLSYNSIDDYVRQAVTFSFRKWKEAEIPPPPPPPGPDTTTID